MADNVLGNPNDPYNLMLAAAVAADEWVATKNIQAGDKPKVNRYNSGWVETFQELYPLHSEGLDTGSIIKRVQNLNTRGVNWGPSQGNNIFSVKFRKDLENSGLGKALLAIFDMASLYSTAKNQLSLGRALFQDGVNKNGFDVREVSLRSLNTPDENDDTKIREFWLAKLTHDISSIPILEAQYVVHILDGQLNSLIEKCLNSSEHSYPKEQKQQFKNLVFNVIYIRMSEREYKGMSKVRLPFLKSFQNLDLVEIQEAFDALFMENPNLVTDIGLKDLSMGYQDAVEFQRGFNQKKEADAKSRALKSERKKEIDERLNQYLNDPKKMEEFRSWAEGKVFLFDDQRPDDQRPDDQRKYKYIASTPNPEYLIVKTVSKPEGTKFTFSAEPPGNRIKTKSLCKKVLEGKTRIVNGAIIINEKNHIKGRPVIFRT